MLMFPFVTFKCPSVLQKIKIQNSLCAELLSHISKAAVIKTEAPFWPEKKSVSFTGLYFWLETFSQIMHIMFVLVSFHSTSFSLNAGQKAGFPNGTVFQDISACLASEVKKAADFASTHNYHISSCFTQLLPI